jgi:uncharacterized protein
MNRLYAVLVAIAILGLALPASAVPLARLRDPRPAAWVLDDTGTLDQATRAALEAAARDVRSAALGELMVVVIDSVDGEPPRAYATRLFNAWRIGTGARDDGVLVLAALSDRKAEIVLGDGLDGPEQVRASESIMQSEMVPRFKDGDAPGALLAGARACAGRILRAPGFEAAAASGGAGSFFIDHPIGAILGSLVMTLGLVGAGRAIARRRPRRCSRCGARMARLSEAEDDAHLDAAEKTEEEIGSVDYDIWMCTCGEAEKLRYGALLTRYSACPSCGAKTKLKTTTTLQSATEHSEGLAEIEERCVHCDYNHTFTRTIPRDTSSSSSSSGGSSGGGGSSSGGGASGSW